MVSSEGIGLVWWLPQELVAETLDIQEAIHNVLQAILLTRIVRTMAVLSDRAVSRDV